MAGLVGSGRTEVARAIFGADRVDRGDIVVDGEVLSLRRPRTAISRGVMLLPESRGEQGLMRWRSIKENLVMADLLSVSRMGLIRAGEECAKTRELVNSLGVRCSSVDAPVAELSGGNQQKVLFGKCVFRRPRVLILDEPTRGVDVGAQMAIRELIHTFVADGGAVLLISSELEEVLGLSHRVLVMRGGHLVATLTADEADKHTVLAIAFGREPSGRAA
jgi:ABC-type sugar transport system ATPase subunit